MESMLKKFGSSIHHDSETMLCNFRTYFKVAKKYVTSAVSLK